MSNLPKQLNHIITKYPLKHGITDRGFPYIEAGKKVVQKDKHGNWNAFTDGIIKENYKNLSDALEEFMGVRLDTKLQFDAFRQDHPSIWRQMMSEIISV